MENLFKGIFDTDMTAVVSAGNFLLCIGAALLCGLCAALCYTFKNRYTKSFVVTLAVLPAVVCVVIMMVNGNVGAGVAVAGAFSLVRFRSAPGTAKEIGMIFLAMGAGLICGMGYLAYGLLFTLITCAVFLLYTLLGLGSGKSLSRHRTLNVTIPEDLNYTEVFDGIFAEYAKEWETLRVKTVNMGSMFRITYNITLKDPSREKEFIDKLRERNGNLEISLAKQDNQMAEL